MHRRGRHQHIAGRRRGHRHLLEHRQPAHLLGQIGIDAGLVRAGQRLVGLATELLGQPARHDHHLHLSGQPGVDADAQLAPLDVGPVRRAPFHAPAPVIAVELDHPAFTAPHPLELMAPAVGPAIKQPRVGLVLRTGAEHLLQLLQGLEHGGRVKAVSLPPYRPDRDSAEVLPVLQLPMLSGGDAPARRRFRQAARRSPARPSAARARRRCARRGSASRPHSRGRPPAAHGARRPDRHG